MAGKVLSFSTLSKMTENENLQLNRLIMANAIHNGLTDCTGPIVIYYNVKGRYVFILVEEYTGMPDS